MPIPETSVVQPILNDFEIRNLKFSSFLSLNDSYSIFLALCESDEINTVVRRASEGLFGHWKGFWVGLLLIIIVASRKSKK